MTAVTEDARLIDISGDLKRIVIKSAATCETGFTIDLASDSTNAKGVVMTRVLGVVVHPATGGLIRTATWATATGIITVGTVTTGIHNIDIVGY